MPAVVLLTAAPQRGGSTTATATAESESNAATAKSSTAKSGAATAKSGTESATAKSNVATTKSATAPSRATARLTAKGSVASLVALGCDFQPVGTRRRRAARRAAVQARLAWQPTTENIVFGV
tara:strand:- start:1965 stop:2333 length:369 start_codon:yes stop_codon:yes gene_type:complete